MTREIEQVISEAETHGWEFVFVNNQFKGKCACGKHQHVIFQGKRSPNKAWKNMRTQLMACPRWTR